MCSEVRRANLTDDPDARVASRIPLILGNCIRAVLLDQLLH